MQSPTSELDRGSPGGHPNEAQRLEALRGYRVLDTCPEPAFDDLVQVVAELLKTPVALVSFVDASRLWFKARVGFDATELPRENSFCDRVVASGQQLVVADVQTDPRFARCPLTGRLEGVRFYVGVPLTDPEGHVLGSLCALDTEAHHPSPGQLSAIHALARQVVAQLEFRRRADLLRRREAVHQAMLNALPDLFFRLDAQGRYLEWHGAAPERLFVPPERFLGKFISETLPPDVGAQLSHAVAEAARTRRTQRVEYSLELPNGLRHFEARIAQSIMDETIVIIDDITDRRRAMQMQADFVSTVSHELRTPLTSIRGSLGLIAGGVLGELPEAAKDVLALAVSNCDRLSRLVDDILEVEALGRSPEVAAPTKVELRAVVQHACAANKPYAAQFATTIVGPGVGPDLWVSADPDRLAQVLANLISNAAKFSPPEGVIEVSLEASAAGARVSVRDHGKGVPEAFRERIFQRFAQADASDSRRRGGTGLGLSIARGIVEAYGGSIGFESAEGGGTRFTFELPTV